MIEAPLFSGAGAKQKSTVSLPTDFFDGTVNEPVLHQAVKVYLANQRQGTHQTKTRSFVSGGNQKPWKQKGTGRARQGSTRAPHWPGGGTVFGPQPRDYRGDLPRKVRQLARRSALNARASEGALHVVDTLGFEAPKTSRLVGLLKSMELSGKKVLVLTNGIKPNVYLSGRNLPSAQVLPYADASAYHVLWADALVVEQGALTGEAPVPEPTPAPTDTTAAPKKARATKPKAEAAPKAAKKAAPKKKAATKSEAPKAKKAPAAKKPASKKKGGEE
jgi:large subunit ribosomal protein L4